MKRFAINAIGMVVFAGVVGVALLGGCGSDSTTQPVDEFAPPTNLTYVNGSAEVDLEWDPSPDATVSDFGGYHVYRYTQTMIGATSQQLATYKLTAQPITVTDYIDATAHNGTKYFYAVRAVKTNGDLSQPTAEIDTAPRDEGPPVTLWEFAYSGQSSGLGCSTSQAYAMESQSPDNRLFIDVYLGTTDVLDDSGSSLALKSPSLVLNGNARWALRVAELKLLDSWDDPTTGTTGWTDQVNLQAGGSVVGKVIAVRTPAAANGQYHYAKVKVQTTKGVAGQRQISVKVAYQGLADYIRFSARR
jgi:hypothetical protein